MKVLQNAYSWLPLTQSWMHTQISYLPTEFDTLIACNLTENLDVYGNVGPIRCLQDEAPVAEYFIRKILRKARLLRELGWLKKPIRDFRPDVVHSHFGHIAWSTMPEVPRSIPHVVTVYGFDISQLPQAFPRWRLRYLELFETVTGVLCEGEHMASCVEHLGCPKDKIIVQRLGVRLEQIPFRPRKWDGQEPLRVLLAGTFTEKKGLPYAIRALGRLARVIPIQITVIGEAQYSRASQLEKQKILSAVHEENLTESVIFLGYQPHLRLIEEAYKHHVFLSPSVTAENGDTEGGAPVTIIEMAATGMPIISTKHCDIPGVIIDGQTGLLAEERDVKGIYERMMWLIDNSDRWSPMLNAARTHLEINFCAQKQGNALAKIYFNL